MNKIVVSTIVNSTADKAWDYYNQPEHIVNWNFADPSWHCPSATNDMKVGGKYCARMEAKDGSFGFDFDATYVEITPGKQFTYEFGGRYATVEFEEEKEQTKITITFDAEQENPIELQEAGWQAILKNFEKYVASNE